MAFTKIKGTRIAAVVTCVPEQRFDNLKDTTGFTQDEVRKVVAMAGVNARRVAGDSICSSDLCLKAAETALVSLKWEPSSIDAVIMVTQTPDYFLPSTACVVHRRLKLSDHCAAFDINLGCSGYPYGLWLASMMLSGRGFRRVLLLHGDTPSRYSDQADRSVSLLFGDAGSATALESVEPGSANDWSFALHTDGEGHDYMIINAGGFRDRFNQDRRDHCVRMQGANVFNFTIRRLPDLIQETLQGAGKGDPDVDYYVFHQSNRYIINYLVGKLKITREKVPMTLDQYGNTGGPSIPLTLTQGGLKRTNGRPLTMMLLGYGVGLSWSSALVTLEPGAILDHTELSAVSVKS